MRPFAPALACLVLSLLSSPAPAVERPALAVMRAASPLHVDGVLDEPAWAAAGEARAFQLMSPREGEAPAESTSIRVLRDGERLVFAIRCGARRAPHAGLAARDQVLDGDHISVHLDTDGDGQRAYIFGVNPYGVQVDGILTGGPDFKWDGVWDAAAHRETGEWTAELAIPFRILRISAAGRPWRLWVRRESSAWNEVSTWPLYQVGTPGPVMLQAADLTGLDDAHGGRELTLEPYLFGASLGTRALGFGAPGPWATEDSQEVGADVQAAVTQSLVMNATINPDFSQIESDALQISVNRRFPLRFPEKRPFFLEGADHFATLMDLVETRRIADPRWGLKLTGRAGAWNTGALVVRDAGGALLAGSGYTSSNDFRESRPGWFTLSRAQLPFGKGANIGALVGTHFQEPESGTGLREDRTFNGFGGLDTQLRLSEHWTTEGQIVATMTHLDSVEAVPAVRRTAHFNDWMGVLRFRYRDHARELHMGARHLGRYFRDELGYQDYAGVTYRRLGGSWDLFPKTGPLQRIAPIFDVLLVHDRTGRLELSNIEAGGDIEFRKSAFVYAGYIHNDEHWLSRTYPQDRAKIFANWTAWRPLSLDADIEVGDAVLFGDDDATSRLVWNETVSLGANLRPDPRLTTSAKVVRFRLADSPGADDLLAVWLIGIKTTAQFTRRLSVRIYPQYESSSKHLDVNALAGYVVQPGTVFYVGVNSGWDSEIPSRIRRATSRQVFAKASWRFAR